LFWHSYRRQLVNAKLDEVIALLKNACAESSPLSTPNEWHFRGHYGQKQHVRIERQAGHVHDCPCHVIGIDRRLGGS
jgi:hypothetical protein